MKNMFMLALLLTVIAVSGSCSKNNNQSTGNTDIKPELTMPVEIITKSPSIAPEISNDKSDYDSTDNSEVGQDATKAIEKNEYKTINDLKNSTVIENQSFWVDLENWGKVHFLSVENNSVASTLDFFLANDQDKILYQFPEFYGNMWIFYNLDAVAFRDVNKDGWKDICIIAEFMTGAGPKAAEPFLVGSIYFQNATGFESNPTLDDKYLYSAKNINIESLIDFYSNELDKKYDDNLCLPNEKLLIRFNVENTDKVVAVSIAKDNSYIVYRYGAKERIELEYPLDIKSSWDDFKYSYYIRGGGAANEGLDLNSLIFEDGGYRYEIYQNYSAVDDTTDIGEKITNLRTQELTERKGITETVFGDLSDLRSNDRVNMVNK